MKNNTPVYEISIHWFYALRGCDNLYANNQNHQTSAIFFKVCLLKK